jgi:FkbH-like protein
MFKKQVKCVIWDLDETIWDGSLAELDNIVARSEAIELIKRLDEKGIVNAICSKNSYDEARKKLEELGVWNYFVFSVIDFVPKGQSVKNIISNMQLRADNVLFVDDNIGNRQEVQFYCENIMVGDPTEHFFWDELRQVVEKTSGSSRLAQYKIMEQKHTAKQQYVDNRSFLEDSQITMCVLRNPADMTFKERIFDLANRSNQLNFTKSKFGAIAELETYLGDENSVNIHHGAIFVYDKYGDYGLVGFYAFDERKEKRTLDHFFFSCRILNMGIEHALYSLLLTECGIKKYAPLEPATGGGISYVRVIRDIDDRLRHIIEKDSETPAVWKTSVIAGCTSGIIDHYLVSGMRPVRFDLSVLPTGKTVQSVDNIIYSVYSDYVDAPWEPSGGFSYDKFRKNFAQFLKNHQEKNIYLLLASEKQMSYLRHHSSSIIQKLKRFRTAVTEGKTNHRFLNCNKIVRETARGCGNVSLIETGEFVHQDTEEHNPTHFDRIVINRICEHIGQLDHRPAHVHSH